MLWLYKTTLFHHFQFLRIFPNVASISLIIIFSVAIFKIIESNLILLCGWEEHCEYEPDERPATGGNNEISQIVILEAGEDSQADYPLL